MIYAVDVAWSSHDDLHVGRVDRRAHRVVVDASSPAEATLIAAQIVACVGPARWHAATGMPTRVALHEIT